MFGASKAAEESLKALQEQLNKDPDLIAAEQEIEDFLNPNFGVLDEPHNSGQ